MADAISGIGAAATTGKAAQDAQKLADDLDDFMTLLTTQLQHQDPLDPMDATEFTSQLVQFASVEQQIAANSNLEALLTAQENSQLASVAGYVGHYIEAESSNVQVYAGQSEFNYILHEDAKATLISVQDEYGRTVMTAEGETYAGKHGVVWDGTDLNGNQVADGIYKLQVTALDADGAPVEVTTTSVGVVTGVSYAGKEPVLMLNNQSVGLDQVLTLKEEAIQLSEVDSIASASLKAQGYYNSAKASSEAATASAEAAQATADANPDSEDAATAAAEAQTAAEAAAKALADAQEAAAAAEAATSSSVALDASANASTAAAAAAKAAADAEKAAAAAAAAVEV